MAINQEYLNAISKKLDTFNKINGTDPQIKNEMFKDDFDFMEHAGKAGMEYIKRNQSTQSKIEIDPLFTNHNNF
jgi:hypothetical protein